MPEIEELKRVPCNCGGKAILRKRIDGYYDVFCDDCTITTVLYKTPEAAVQAWNYTMGDRNDRTAKVKAISNNLSGVGRCECGDFVSTVWTYCPNCGAKLIWD